jgi:predicted tellurium resistance membrane protein TerC
MDIPDFLAPGTWVSLLTLSFLEIVLGIDNIIFISIVTDKLPAERQRRARNIGLMLAMGFRICLLLAINWIIGLKAVVFSVPLIGDAGTLDLSYKDLILIGGGLFLIVKSTLEIHHKLMKQHPVQQRTAKQKPVAGFGAILLQVVMIDAVFSFDSILTAIGLVENVFIMMMAVVISIAIMMLFAGGVARVINANPTLQMLALSFLVVIGVVLIAGGFHEEISKSIIYSCLCFSLVVELLNIRLRKQQEASVADEDTGA